MGLLCHKQHNNIIQYVCQLHSLTYFIAASFQKDFICNSLLRRIPSTNDENILYLSTTHILNAYMSIQIQRRDELKYF